MQRIQNTRRNVIVIVIIIVGFLYLVRLFYIQVINTTYKLSAENNVLRYITDYPSRGLIYDRNGKLLVYNEAVYDIMVVPNVVSNIDTNELCQMIHIDKASFEERMQKAADYSQVKPSIFFKQLSKEDYGQLSEKMYKYPGFFIQARTVRKYPIPVAAHILGYVGEVNKAITEKDPYYKPGDYIGVSGIEKSYEQELRGKKGVKIMLVDVFNRIKGSFSDGTFDTTAVAGKNLYTSLDADLQAYGERLMENKRGSIVAIEPATGELITLVTSPTYDPNLLVGRIRTENYQKLMQDPKKPLFDRALMAQYPPGSTFKTVTALAALQTGVITPNTRYSCPGGFFFGGVSVACHGHVSPVEVIKSLQHSCNTYYSIIFRHILDKQEYGSVKNGFSVWRDLVMSFGLGKKLGADLPQELSGNIPTVAHYDRYHGKNRWKSLSVISLAIGQGEILTTPLQLANLAAIIANKGYYYTPHIVTAVGKNENKIKDFNHKVFTKIDPEYYSYIIEGMQLAVDAGTAPRARIDSISVCGKTGTAQNPHGENHSLFIAFAPRENPQIAIAVVVENSGYGGTWAAPIAGLIMEKYLKGDISDHKKFQEEIILNANFINIEQN